MDFEQWLAYVEAIEENSTERTICLLELINIKLDLAIYNDFSRAERAIQQVLNDGSNRKNSGMVDDSATS